MEDSRCSKNKAGAGRPGTNSWDLLSCVSLLVLKEDRDSGIDFFSPFLTPLKHNDLEDLASPGSFLSDKRSAL